jgi:ABC-type transport system substrate-binding protein
MAIPTWVWVAVAIVAAAVLGTVFWRWANQLAQPQQIPVVADANGIGTFHIPTGPQGPFEVDFRLKCQDQGDPQFDGFVANVDQALWYAFNQEDFLMATVGDENYIKPCKALFICDTPLATTKGMDALLTSNAKKAQELLKEAGYDGTPVVLMHSTDLKALTNLAPVAKSLMEKAGFKVDMQSMDWQTLVARRAKKDPPDAGGWNAFLTAWVAADVMNPVSTAYVNAACDKASFGWPCDAQLEKLRDDFARAMTDEELALT